MKAFSRMVLFVGIGAAIFGLGAAHARRNDYVFTDNFRFPWLIAFFAVVCVLAYGLALPDVARAPSGLRRGLAACLGGAGAISIAQLLLGTPVLPRFVILGSFLLVPLIAAAATEILGSGRRQSADRDRLLAIVNDEDAETLRRDLSGHIDNPVSLIATLPPDCDPGEIAKLSEQHDVAIIVLGREAQLNQKIVDVTSALHISGTRVRPLLGFYEEWVGKLPVAELRRTALFFDIGDVHAASYRRSARAIDVLIGIAGTIVLLALIPFVLLGNLIANRGPIFYRQPRVGKDGRIFQILKLRSMSSGTENTEWTAEGDMRITPFGKLLRHSHLDELPQVVNILKGELSAVGPRPEQPHYVEQLAQSIPFYDLRHAVTPGLTGWAQINYEYGNTEFDALQKLQFEFYYLRHQSLWLDLQILARTLQSVIGLKGK